MQRESLTERTREYGRAQECFSVRCKLCQLIKIYELIQTPWYLSAPASEYNRKNPIFVSDIKRLIGHPFNTTSVQSDMELWPFQVINDKVCL